MELTVSNFGATIVSLMVPDKYNKQVDVVIGLENPEEYTTKKYRDYNLFLGSSIGRYAGRISGGKLKIEGVEYQLYNENGVHLHLPPLYCDHCEG